MHRLCQKRIGLGHSGLIETYCMMPDGHSGSCSDKKPTPTPPRCQDEKCGLPNGHVGRHQNGNRFWD